MKEEKYIVFKACRQEFWICSIMTALIPQAEFQTVTRAKFEYRIETTNMLFITF